jgi:hypothetical protein
LRAAGASAASAETASPTAARTVACQVRKSLGGVVVSRDLAQVVVNVPGSDVVPAFAAAVDEEILQVRAGSSQLQAADDREDVGVDDGLLLLLAALPDVIEADLAVPAARHVLPADGSQSVRAVLGRVLVAARTEESQVDQPDGGREHALPGQRRAPAQMTARHGSDLRHRPAEFQRPSNFSRSLSSRQLSWYRYWRRPAASVPTAWLWPSGSGQIHTSSHAGGMTSVLMRDSVAALVTGAPSGLR